MLKFAQNVKEYPIPSRNVIYNHRTRRDEIDSVHEAKRKERIGEMLKSAMKTVCTEEIFTLVYGHEEVADII